MKNNEPLPPSHATHINMHKLRSWIVPDASTMQSQRGIAEFGSANARHADVDRHCLHVQTVPGDGVPVLS